jgi:hypothetical protein
MGTAGYSYDIVVAVSMPVLEKLGKVAWVENSTEKVAEAAQALRAEGLIPFHLAFLAFQDVAFCDGLPVAVAPAWEFPDLPDFGFGDNPQNDWIRTAERCDLVLVGGPFTERAFREADISSPVAIMQIPTPDGYFRLPAWSPNAVTVIEAPCRAYPLEEPGLPILPPDEPPEPAEAAPEQPEEAPEPQNEPPEPPEVAPESQEEPTEPQDLAPEPQEEPAEPQVEAPVNPETTEPPEPPDETPENPEPPEQANLLEQVTRSLKRGVRQSSTLLFGIANTRRDAERLETGEQIEQVSEPTPDPAPEAPADPLPEATPVSAPPEVLPELPPEPTPDATSEPPPDTPRETPPEAPPERAPDPVPAPPRWLAKNLIVTNRPTTELSGIVYTSIFNPNDGRKNWKDLVSAFVLELGDCEDATLVIKLVSSDTLAINHFIHHYEARDFQHRCKLVFISDFLTFDQMIQLANASTYYFQTTRAEGNCLPLMNFIAAGRPGVSPNHSAIQDYFDDEIGFVIESHPEPCAWPQEPQLCHRTFWNRIVWPSAAQKLRESYDIAKTDQATYRRMAETGKERMRRWASEAAVGRRLEKALAGIADTALEWDAGQSE